jgi:hypothetical protein
MAEFNSAEKMSVVIDYKSVDYYQRRYRSTIDILAVGACSNNGYRKFRFYCED